MQHWLLGHPWLLPLAAFAAMAGQDVLGTLLVQAEASYRAHRAGLLDALQDLCWIASYIAIGDSLLVGHDYALSAVVIAARLAADYSATYTGVRIGRRLDRKVAP